MAPAFSKECPICHDGFNFKEPKIMPCTHMVCRQCLQSWMEASGAQSGCPLCRVPILPYPLKSETQDDVAKAVDSLLTDLATQMIAHCQWLLTTGTFVCVLCSLEALFLCMQCHHYLCFHCAVHHFANQFVHYPAKLLSNVTAEELAKHALLVCSIHEHVKLNLFCTQCEELVCLKCIPLAHKFCSEEIQDIWSVGPVKREEIRSQARVLAKKEAEFTEKISLISKVHTKFKAKRYEKAKAKVGSHSKQEQQLKSFIDRKLNRLQAYKVYLEKLLTSVTGHRKLAERVVAEAEDVALLGMVKKLMPRLKRETLWSREKRQYLLKEDKAAKEAENRLHRLFQQFEIISPQHPSKGEVMSEMLNVAQDS